MIRNKFYTFTLIDTVLPGANSNPIVDLFENNMRFNIKSITYFLEIYYTVLNKTEFIPVEANHSQGARVYIRRYPLNSLFGSPITDNTAGVKLIENSIALILTKPGQYTYQNVFCEHGLRINFQYNNMDLLNTIHYLTNLIIETDIIEKI